MVRTPKVQMPSSMGGLVRYFDEYRSKYQIKPTVVIIMVVIVIFIITSLHLTASELIR